MSLSAHAQNLVSSSCSDSWSPVKSVKAYYFHGRIPDFDYLLFNHVCMRKECRMRHCHGVLSKFSLSFRFPNFKNQGICFNKLRRIDRLLPFASTDDGVTVNGSSQARTNDNVEEMRYKLNKSLQVEDFYTGLVQLLHDSARIFELAIKGQSSKMSWLSTTLLGVDKSAWAKALSYQASVYSLLRAANEISSRGDGRDRDVNVVVQGSLSRQAAPLENAIQEKLLAKQAEAYDWFWSDQIPLVVASFVSYLEKDKRFESATAVHRKGLSSISGSSSDLSLLMLALSCNAAISKLGPTKVSCPHFFSAIPDINGRLMDMLVEFIPIRQAYRSIKEIGLHREFLIHFGPRAAAFRIKTEMGAEEITFWVGLVQKKLQKAIDRERIWSRLTTCESIEVLERDLAVFGFFIALARSTQSFLFANGFQKVDETIEGFLRYLIGGSVLYYPQLSAISSYQLYVEVVCEELDWLPFYPSASSNSKVSFGHKKKDSPPNAEAIPIALDVCSHWIQSFIKYSKWLEDPSNVKAARFISKGHEKLKACMEVQGIQQFIDQDISPSDRESESFDKALESVEGAVLRLEELLQELHVSSSNSGNEHLKAACSDLERIRRLKKEAEFLEASFRAKAASLQQGDDISSSTSPVVEKPMYSRDKGRKSSNVQNDRNNRSYGLWNSFVKHPAISSDINSSVIDEINDDCVEEDTTSSAMAESTSKEIHRFELLQSELMELEERVKESTNRFAYEGDETQVTKGMDGYRSDSRGARQVQVQKKDSIIDMSLVKLKETSTDVMQGSQLLAIDVAAAVGLLRRGLIGDELTEKEKQALRRTLTDLASVIPIGFLMLLPVTAVGHAAMLAAIQRYVPGLIPSTYGPDRLDLLRKVEKLKAMEVEANFSENSEE